MNDINKIITKTVEGMIEYSVVDVQDNFKRMSSPQSLEDYTVTISMPNLSELSKNPAPKWIAELYPHKTKRTEEEK